MTEADSKALDHVRGVFAPHRLRMARELAGISQGELSDAGGVSAAAVSQYERGSATPSVDVVRAFARRLGVPAGFFSVRDSGAECPAFFRSLRSAPAAERKRARHVVQLVHEVVGALEADVRLPALDVPRHPLPSDAEEDEPEAAAGAVRRAWSVSPGPIDNMVRLAERHGVIVTRLGSGHHQIDAFSVPFADRPVLVMSAAKGKRDRSRLDVAHELGHLVMHEPGQATTRAVEKQAQAFAAAFLMPADEIRPELPSVLDWERLITLKRRWQVSLAALLYRCNTLGTFGSEGTYVQAMKAMSARGWRRHEPADLGEPESPILLEEAMRVAGVTEAELADRTAIPLNTLRDVLDLAADDRPEVVI